jgi:hypothetical protein
MGRNYIEEIKNDGHGNITILHSNGAFHYNEEDVVRKEWTNDFLCFLDFNSIPKGHVAGFVGLATSVWLIIFFFFDTYCLSPRDYIIMKKKMEGYLVFTYLIFSFLILPIIGYILTRCYYFFCYRDFFQKQILNIHLKSNQSGLFYHFIDDKKRIQTNIFYKRENSFYSNVEERIYSNVLNYIYLREILLVILIVYVIFPRCPNYNIGMEGIPIIAILMGWLGALFRPHPLR